MVAHGVLLEADKHALRAVARAAQLDPPQNIAVRVEDKNGAPNATDVREERAGDDG